jgi:hypothetical protein
VREEGPEIQRAVQKGFIADPLERAAFHFGLIKIRIRHMSDIVDILRDDEQSLKYIVMLDHAYFCARKMIEELLLLSLCAHEHAGEIITNKMKKVWSAETMVKEISKINKNYFPDAIRIVETEEEGLDGRFVSVDDVYLTEEFLIEFYAYCHRVVHASSSVVSPEDIRSRLAKLADFNARIKRLLHTFEIDISGSGYILLGQLEFENKDAPKIFWARGGAPRSKDAE